MEPESRHIIDQLVRRIYDLETRMAQMERRVAGVPPVQEFPPQQEFMQEVPLELSDPAMASAAPIPPPVPMPPGPTAYSQIRPETQGYLPETPQTAGYVPPPPAPVIDPLPEPPPITTEPVETQAGLVWVNRIASVTVIIGAAFFFKYAVDNDWIGPAGRVIIGVLMAALAIAGGDRLWHRGHKVFAQGITALGICTLFLSFWASFGLYKLIPQSAAFGLLVMATAASGALALRYNARITAILALLGGYATPALVSTGSANHLFLGAYLLVLNAAAVYVARRQGWRSVEIVGMVCTFFLHGVWYAEKANEIGKLPGVIFTIGQMAIFGSSPAGWQSITAQILGGIGIAAFFREQWDEYFFVSAGIVAAIGLVWAAIKRHDLPIAGAFAGWMFGVSAWNGPMTDHPGGTFVAMAIAFLAFLMSALFIRVQSVGIPTFTTVGLNGIFFFSVATAVLDKDFKGYLGMLAIAVAASYLLAAVRLRNSGNQKGAILGAGLALAFLTVAIPVQLTGYSITIGWAIEAAALAWIALRLNSIWVLGGSWLVGWLVLMRLVMADATAYWPATGEPYTLFVNPRFLPFLAAAISYALIAYFASTTSTLPSRLAGIPMLLAHFTLLWGLHLEAFAYIGATNEFGPTATSLKALVSSILLAAYGLLMIAIGISKSETFHRLLGLLLFALVILKLYFFDVWLMGTGFRILAFVGLGGLLFAGSFLYSRYRGKISALWKEPANKPNETPTA